MSKRLKAFEKAAKKAHKKTDAVAKTQTKASKSIADSTEKTIMIPVEKLLKPDDYFRKNGLDAEAEKMLFKKLINEEQQHYNIFANTYDFLNDTGNWFMWEDHSIVEG